MKLKEYISEYLPKKCGVHPSFGGIAWIVFCEEQNGNPAFANDKFESARERAKLGMPYNPENKQAYEEGLDVLELMILAHRQKKHKENNHSRINELEEKRTFTDNEISVLASEWWNG